MFVRKTLLRNHFDNNSHNFSFNILQEQNLIKLKVLISLNIFL